MKSEAINQGGLYFDFGIIKNSMDYSETIKLISSSLNLTESIPNYGINMGVGWSIVTQAYFFGNGNIFGSILLKGRDNSTEYEIKSGSWNLGAGIDLIKKDEFDICPSLGWYKNISLMTNRDGDEIASYNKSGINCEICLRLNVFSYKNIFRRGVCSFALKSGYQVGIKDKEWDINEKYPLIENSKVENRGFYLAFTVGVFLNGHIVSYQ